MFLSNIRGETTPKEIVLSGYQCFSEGDMEGLGKIFHANALIKCNGDHEFSGEYHGFDGSQKIAKALGG